MEPIFICEDGTIVAQPAEHTVGHMPNRSLISVAAVNSLGDPISESLHVRGAKIITDTALVKSQYEAYPPREKLEGHWFYGGILFNHFGHFLAESVHRLRSYISKSANFDGVVFIDSPLFKPNSIETEFVRHILFEFFGLCESGVVVLSRNTAVERLSVSKQESCIGSGQSREYLKFLEKLEAAYAQRTNLLANTYPKRIFLSRKNYLAKGRIVGLDALEEPLRENGFSIVFPEELSLQDQIGMALQAKEIVAEEGSALHIYDILGYRSADLALLCRRSCFESLWLSHLTNRFSNVRIFRDVASLDLLLSMRPEAQPVIPDIDQLIIFLKSIGIKFNSRKFRESFCEFAVADLKALKLFGYK